MPESALVSSVPHQGSQSGLTVKVPHDSWNLYSVLQQEVGLGVQLLNRGNADMAVTFFQSALQKMTADQPLYDHLVYNLLVSYRLLIQQLLQTGERSLVLEFLRAALSLEISGKMAEDTLFLRQFAGVFQDLSIAFLQNGLNEPSLLCCRKAISVCPGHGSYVNLTNSLASTGQAARLSDFTDQITPEQLGRHIFIACLPKSGSTFLKNLLLKLTGYRDLFTVYAAGQTEHEIYLPTLREFAHLDTVTQQHCRASDANIHLMQAFGIRPVVLVRNIFDSVMSLLDFYNHGAFKTSYFRADWPMLDEEAKIDLLIDHVIPWYLQFVASWDQAEREKRVELCWLSYEELITDKCSSVLKLLEFYGLGASSGNVQKGISEVESDGGKNRFNKGVMGRGRSILSAQQKERVRRLARYFPSADFSIVGL